MPATVTPYDILAGLFDPETADNVHLCSQAGDPQAVNWTGYRVKERFPDCKDLTLDPAFNQWFSVGMASRQTSTRSNTNVMYDYLVVLDDVGQKVPKDRVEGLRAFGIEPVLVVETSPGNWQYFYRLDRPIDRGDPDQLARMKLLDLIRMKLAEGQWGDKAVQDPSRYMRLPFGVNGKTKYLVNGKPPAVLLTEFNVGQRVTLEDLADVFVGAGWRDQVATHQVGARPASASHGDGDRNAVMDSAYARLAEHIGLDPYQVRPGVVNALCPNRAQHTNNDATGFAFINPYRGHCNHDHCQHISAYGFMDMIEQEYEAGVAARLAAGELEELEGHLHVKGTGEYVPRTGRTWMAHWAFSQAPLSTTEMAAVERAAASYEERRNRTPDWVRELNERYCLVRTIPGVVDLKPSDLDGTLFNVMTNSHFRTFLDAFKVPLGKKNVGQATAWLDHTAARRYDAVGLWPPGQEPAGALNLFPGIVYEQSKAKSCRQFLDYVRDVLCDGRQHVYDYLLNWTAWVIQNPLKKPGVNIVLFGSQGTGKSTFGNKLIDVFGTNFGMSLTNPQHLMGHFNAHLEGKLIVMLDEALFGKDPRIVGQYKTLTTDDTLVIERKGIDARTVVNMMAFVICSNSLAAVPIEAKDRRATVLQVSDARANDTAYFKALHAEWDDGGREAFIMAMLSRDVSSFDPRIPLDTPEKADMAATTADVATRYWMDRVNSGLAPGGKDWSQPIDLLMREVEADHVAWAQLNGVKPAGRPELSRRINELCPKRTVWKPRVGVGRENGHHYPSLAECQALMDRALGAGG